jgi:hypothetical protein
MKITLKVPKILIQGNCMDPPPASFPNLVVPRKAGQCIVLVDNEAVVAGETYSTNLHLWLDNLYILSTLLPSRTYFTYPDVDVYGEFTRTWMTNVTIVANGHVGPAVRLEASSQTYMQGA